MTHSAKKRLFSAAVLCAAAQLVSIDTALAADPGSYAKMGSSLWRMLSDRQAETTKAELIPFYVFTDGETLTVVPQAFVANYSVNQENPIKLVLPGPKTVEESEKYPLLTPAQFMEKNKNFVNKVTSRNPVRSNMLNIYTTNMGTPTTVDHMGKN